MRKIRMAIKMGSSKLPSLDPLDELDPLGKDQDKYDLMAVFLIIEDRFGEGITKLCEDESEWDDPNGNRSYFDLFEDIVD